MDTITPIIKALEAGWASIQANHPTVPGAVILCGPALKAGLLGHFAPQHWQNTAAEPLHEVLITAESLQRKPAQIMCTLIHEAAHASNNTKKVRDVIRNGYHNKKFKLEAEMMGLTVHKDGNRGTAGTTIPDETTELYRDEIAQLKSVLKLYRRSFKKGTGSAKPRQKSRMLKCECPCGFIIRLSRKVFEATGILCETCDEHFDIKE